MHSDAINKTRPHPLTLAISAMGGQGGGVLTEWLLESAENSGLLVQSTSVPGVAQRTGSTVYYLEFFPVAEAEKAGKEPIMALMPAPGDVDIVIAGELMEAGRAILRGFVTPGKTTLISSTHRDYALVEKMAMGDGRLDTDTIIQSARISSRTYIGFDMAGIAEATGSIISSVLLGAIAGSNVLPVTREFFEAAIRHGGKGVNSSLAGFAAGFDRARAIVNNRPDTKPAEPEITKIKKIHPAIGTLIERINMNFPAPLRDTLMEGCRRLVDYQDPGYATAYLDSMEKILTVDTDHAGTDQDYRLSLELARYLALWMSIEDGIRVADLKIRSGRFARVRNEVHATPDQIVRIAEFMHPRIEEVCDVLPPGLARLILGSKLMRSFINMFCNRGYKVETTSLSGFIMLYLVSSLKSWRRHTYRYQRERTGILSWLETVMHTATGNYDLAVEIVKCQTLIKGYGETYERGLKNFHAILSRLEKIRDRDDAAATARQLREAALADESGSQLQASLLKVA